MASHAVVPVLHFDSTLGAGFIGCLFTAVMYGITCVQSFTFFQNSSRDRKVVKYAIAGLLILDTIHFIFVADTLYWYTVTNFMDPTVIGRIPWTVSGGLIITPISDGVVRCFFTFRIWVLSHKNRLITYPLIGMIIAILGFALAFGIKAFSLPTYKQIAEISWLMYLGLAALMVTDAYIAVVLCYFLYKGRTGFNKGTNSLINILLIYTFFALTTFVTYAALPKTYVFLAVYFPLSKLYFNALLASLNARGQISRRGELDGHVSVPLTSSTRTAQGTIPIEFAPPGTQPNESIERGEEFKTGLQTV